MMILAGIIMTKTTTDTQRVNPHEHAAGTVNSTCTGGSVPYHNESQPVCNQKQLQGLYGLEN